MKIKTLFMLTCMTSTFIGGVYLAYQKGKNSNDFSKEINEYKLRLNEKDNFIDKIQSNMPKPETLIKAIAEEKWGRSEVEALALNGLNECPSSQFQSETTRCNEFEEAAVMYAVINQYKKKIGKSLKEIIYSKIGSTPMFSWTTGGRQTGYTNSAGYEHSRLIASYILSGSGKYTDISQFSQTHYCNDKYVVNGIAKSGCSNWHKPNLIALGRMNFSETCSTRILDNQLSKHNFYKTKD